MVQLVNSDVSIQYSTIHIGHRSGSPLYTTTVYHMVGGSTGVSGIADITTTWRVCPPIRGDMGGIRCTMYHVCTITADHNSIQGLWWSDCSVSGVYHQGITWSGAPWRLNRVIWGCAHHHWSIPDRLNRVCPRPQSPERPHWNGFEKNRKHRNPISRIPIPARPF